jgi:hypothetical protein
LSPRIIAHTCACLWLGTSEGHLLEFDTRARALGAVRPGAHEDVVTHVSAHARPMLDAGRCTVLAPDAGGRTRVCADGAPLGALPCIGAERREFVVLLARQLWTAARAARGGGGGSIVCVMDVPVVIMDTTLCSAVDMFAVTGARRPLPPDLDVSQPPGARVVLLFVLVAHEKIMSTVFEAVALGLLALGHVHVDRPNPLHALD